MMIHARKVVLAAALLAWSWPAAAQQPAPPPTVPAMVAPVQDAQVLRTARAARHLARFDKDNNGSITRSEYQRWYRSTARRRSALTWKRHASTIFRRLDLNRDSKLTLEEFTADPYFRRPRMGR
ncbi:MAG: EF-hand domain-containing protein [Beijerinckiaceae bacterium]